MTTTFPEAKLNQALQETSPQCTDHAAVKECPPIGNIQIKVFDNASDTLEAWAELEEIAAISVYQTRRFALPWLDTIGKSRAIQAMIVLVTDAVGLPLALLPFGVRRHSGLCFAEFLGGRDSNANLGLFRPGIQFDAETLHRILREAAKLSRCQPDVYVLQNQPRFWQGEENPMAVLPAQDSPSQCHSTELLPDPAAFRNQRLNKDARKKLRSKTRKLEEIGALRFITAHNKEDANRILDAFFEQKNQRFKTKNITHTFDTAEAREFFERCAIARLGERGATIELHALVCGDRITATYGGSVHNGRFHAMINSFDQDPVYSRYSPGEVLLGMLIDAKCVAGLKTFDLGIGEGRYKQSWCEHSEPLFDTFIGLTVKGRCLATFLALRQRLKRAVKQNKWAWSLLTRLKAKLRLRSD